MIVLKMIAVLTSSLLAALATGVLLRLFGADVPEAGTVIGATAGVVGALGANLARLRGARPAPARVVVERGRRPVSR